MAIGELRMELKMRNNWRLRPLYWGVYVLCRLGLIHDIDRAMVFVVRHGTTIYYDGPKSPNREQ